MQPPEKIMAGIFTVVLCVVFCVPCLAAPQEKVVNRKVLVLYDSSHGQEESKNNLFRDGLAMVFNYYGLDFDYIDVAPGKFPDDTAMSQYRAVVSVFEAMSVPDPAVYLPWLAHQMDKGRKVMVFGWTGTQFPDGSPVDTAIARSVYSRLGLDYQPGRTIPTTRLAYVLKDQDFVEFERKYPPIPPSEFPGLSPLQDKVRPLLMAKEKNSGQETVYIAVNDHGGIAATGSIYWMDPSSYAKKWYLNPFAFVAAALGLHNEPIPDPTTLNGLRVAISHVDADGFGGFTEVESKSTCGRVMKEQIYEAFDFPITSSIIAAEVNPSYMGKPELVDLAKEIFALPNIEPASHSYTHPFYWDVSKKVELEERYDFAGAYSKPDYKLSAQLEIKDSCAYVSSLSPPDKPCRVLLWSGTCEPVASQIGLADTLGILNMNGGDTVYDQVRDSLFLVSGLYRKVGTNYQIFTGQANENILTNLWTGPYWGFSNIMETMRRTESPRRLKPIDIYYHFYSAEKLASLNALKNVYRWTLQQDIAPLFTSQYINMVLGFISTRVKQLRFAPKENTPFTAYEVSAYGSCTTMRFSPETPAPDMELSENVIGWLRLPQGLYVHLAAEADHALIAPVGTDDAQIPHIRKATGIISDFARENQILHFHYQGFGKGWIELAGLRPDTEYSIHVTGNTWKEKTTRTDAKGRLRINAIKTGNLEILPL